MGRSGSGTAGVETERVRQTPRRQLADKRGRGPDSVRRPSLAGTRSVAGARRSEPGLRLLGHLPPFCVAFGALQLSTPRRGLARTGVRGARSARPAQRVAVLAQVLAHCHFACLAGERAQPDSQAFRRWQSAVVDRRAEGMAGDRRLPPQFVTHDRAERGELASVFLVARSASSHRAAVGLCRPVARPECCAEEIVLRATRSMTEQAFCAREWQRKGGVTLASLPTLPPPGAGDVRVREHGRHERRHPRAALASCLEGLTWLRAFQLAEARAARRANQLLPERSEPALAWAHVPDIGSSIGSPRIGCHFSSRSGGAFGVQSDSELRSVFIPA
jgi:hypothetical protein